MSLEEAGEQSETKEEAAAAARQRGEGAQPPSTYAGRICSLLAASVILLRHLQLRHIRNMSNTPQQDERSQTNRQRARNADSQNEFTFRRTTQRCAETKTPHVELINKSNNGGS